MVEHALRRLIVGSSGASGSAYGFAALGLDPGELPRWGEDMPAGEPVA